MLGARARRAGDQPPIAISSTTSSRSIATQADATADQHYRILQLLGGRHIPKTKKHFGTYTGFIKGADGNFIGQDPKFQVICDCGRKFAYIHRDHCPQCGVRIDETNSPKYLVYVYYYNVKRKKSGLALQLLV